MEGAIPMRALVAPMIVLALLPTAGAHCHFTSDPQVDIDVGAGRFYVIVDFCFGAEPCSFWVYEESNGIDGLQRDDDWVSDVWECGGVIRGDTVVF